MFPSASLRRCVCASRGVVTARQAQRSSACRLAIWNGTIPLHTSAKMKDTAKTCCTCDRPRRYENSSLLWSKRKAQNYADAAHKGRAQFFSTTTGSSTSNAFDRILKQRQRDNAALAHGRWRGGDEVVDYDYFRQEMAYRLVDRLDDIKREEGFPLALDIGAGPGYIHRAICSDDAIDGEGGIGGVRKIVQLDSSQGMLHRDENLPVDGGERCDSYRLVADEEELLPFPDGTFDLVISSQALHWVNDLPRLFREAKRVLKPDGCFIFSMIGGATLPELRVSMVLAELEREGGVSPHVGPFVELSDVGGLLQNAGFSLPTIDIDTVKLAYPNAFVLMEHLQRMGENNASLGKRHRTPLDTFLAAACIYDEMFALDLDGVGAEEGKGDVEASVQVIYAIGWTPHASQQKPLQRGTAKHKLGDAVTHHSSSSDPKS